MKRGKVRRVCHKGSLGCAGLRGSSRMETLATRGWASVRILSSLLRVPVVFTLLAV